MADSNWVNLQFLLLIVANPELRVDYIAFAFGKARQFATFTDSDCCSGKTER